MGLSWGRDEGLFSLFFAQLLVVIVQVLRLLPAGRTQWAEFVAWYCSCSAASARWHIIRCGSVTVATCFKPGYASSRCWRAWWKQTDAREGCSNTTLSNVSCQWECQVLQPYEPSKKLKFCHLHHQWQRARTFLQLASKHWQQKKQHGRQLGHQCKRGEGAFIMLQLWKSATTHTHQVWCGSIRLQEATFHN